MYNTPLKTMLIFMALLLFLLPGCQNTSLLYQGRHVEPEFVVPLPGNLVTDQWETADLIIDYGYSENSQALQINGQVTLADKYAKIYHVLDLFHVYLLFLDSDLSVIKTEILADPVTASPAESFLFDKIFQIPPTATAFSFAYYGTAREIERKAGNSITFFQIPQ